MATTNEIWGLLTNHGKLERDKGIDALKELCDKVHGEKSNSSENQNSANSIVSPSDEIRQVFETLVQYQISANDVPWETKIGILMGCQVIKWNFLILLSIVSLHLTLILISMTV